MLIKHFLNYLGVHVLSRLLPIAAIFLFSFFLTPSELGIVALYLATVVFLATIMSANLHTGIGRFLFDPQTENAPLLGTAIIAIAVSCCLIGFLWLSFAHRIESFLLLPYAVMLLQIPVAFGLISESTLTQVMIHSRRSRLLLGVIATKSLFALTAAVIGVLVLEGERFYGIIVADAIAGVFLTFAVLWILRSDITFKFNKRYFYTLAKYSVPLIFHSLSLVLLSHSDRVIIGHLLGTQSVGIYSLSYAVGAMVLLLSVPALNALQPRFFTAMNAGDARKMTQDAVGVFLLLVLPTAMLVAFGGLVSELVFLDGFASGFSLISLVALGGIFQIHFVIWGRVLAFHNKTVLISVVVAVAACLNILFNFVLIGPLGLQGAALSTVLAQFFMAFTLQLILRQQKFVSQPLDGMQIVLTTGLIAWVAVQQVFPWMKLLWLDGLIVLGLCVFMYPSISSIIRQLSGLDGRG